MVAAKDGVVVRSDRDFVEMTPSDLEELEQRVESQGYSDQESLDRFRGRQVWIDHGEQVVTRYAHLLDIEEGITVGVKVRAGQVIAQVGNSGTPEGVFDPDADSHLHFEIRVDGDYLAKGLAASEMRAVLSQTFAIQPRAVATSISSPTARQSEPSVHDANLEALIRQTLGQNAKSYGVVVRNLTTGTEAVVNPDRVFYAASLYKLPILYEVYKLRELGLLDFDREIELTPYYVEQDQGTLSYLDWEEGSIVAVRQALEAMIKVSDNSSAWMLRDLVGWGLIDADMTRLGLKHTTVDSRELTTSARDMAVLLETMARGHTVSATASREMVDLLTQQTVRDRIPALLPSDTRVANKTGNWVDATHDVAIVYSPGATYVITVLSDRSWDPGPIAEVSLAVYNYFQTRDQ